MFSIIMPVYNGGKFIDEAIKSVFSQSFSDWELIIMDDGSKDNTQAVLEKYSQNEKIHIYTQKNQGVSVARNNAISKANGDYIVFLDADDIWFENHLAVMNELIGKYPDAGLYGTFTKCELVNGETIEECDFFKTHDETVYLEDFFLEYHKDKSAKMFTVITTCLSKEAVKKAGGFPVGCAIGEDLELSLRVAAYYPVVLTKRITAVYKKTNSTATKDISFDPDWRFFDTVRELYSDKEIPESKKENLKKVMQWFIMRRCRHYIIKGQKNKAWKSFFYIGKEKNLKKDKLINLVLLFLPVFVVRKIFKARWSGKA